jgi:hypothetical protein
LQAHETLVLKREFRGPSWFGVLLRLVSPDLPPGLEGLGLSTARTLAVSWLPVLPLLVGHALPSCALLLASFPDFCKRSRIEISGKQGIEDMPQPVVMERRQH